MRRAGSVRIGTLTVAGILAGTVLVGCGDEGDAGAGKDGSPAKATPGAEEQGTRAVRTAYQRTAEQDTARVTLRVRTSAEGKSASASGRGTIDLDDGDSVMTLTTQGQRIEQRVVDQVLYQKAPRGQAPENKQWIKIDLRKVAGQQGAAGQSMNDPAQSAAFARAIDDKDVRKLGSATVDGVRTTRYRVAVDVAELPNGATLRRQVGPTLPMDVWLDDDGRIRRQQVDMTVKAPAGKASSSPQQVKVRTLMDFSDFGTDVEAEAPPSAQVADMTGKALEQGRAGN
jgi:hypothetical protein